MRATPPKIWLVTVLLLSACGGNGSPRNFNVPIIQSARQMLNISPVALGASVSPAKPVASAIPSAKKEQPAATATPVAEASTEAPTIAPQPFSPETATESATENAPTTSAGKKTKSLTIFMYPSFGNEEEITIKGRVFKTEGSDPVTPSASKLKSLWNNLDMLSVHEMKKYPLQVTFAGKTIETKTDDEGIFVVKVHPAMAVSNGYHQATVALLPSDTRYTAQQSDSTIVINRKQDTGFGIVSDIDDTIQKSDVTSKLQALKNLLFKNYTTQEKISGTPELYQALDLRSDGVVDGDVHYLSGSPHQIINRIMHFLEHNQFPKGSLDLKQMGLGSNDDSPTDQLKYKLGKLRNLFNTYPQRKFICFGDSGEKDPEIYRQIAQEYPDRVLGIYINNVNKELTNAPRFQGTIVTGNAAEAAEDLLKKNLLKAEDVEKVRQAVVSN